MIEDADILIMESTYGNRLHPKRDDKAEEFLKIVSETLEQGGNVVIPSFAVGRTQEILYELQKSKQSDNGEFRREYDEVMDAPVYVDSPLATSATEVFLKNLDCLDEEVQQDIREGNKPLDFPDLKFTRSVEESKMLNENTNQSIIISASGMCEVGRIKHHLKHNLWRQDSTILFVGYQAVGTLGRKIVDGAKVVKIFGEEISVNANIKYIEAFSGHADQTGLIHFVDSFQKKPRQIYLVHGEEEAQKELRDKLSEGYGIPIEIPCRGDVFEVSEDRMAKVGEMRSPNEYRFIRLELIQKLENLRDELEEMSIYVKDDIKNETDDERVHEIMEQLNDLENQIVNVVKSSL